MPLPATRIIQNRDGCHELVSVIADHMDFELTKLMQDSPYLGIMIDESTDLSVRKNLLIYINLLLRDGVVVSLFAHLEEMKQCDAASLTGTIVEYLEEKGIELSKSDGASVMVGKQNGVGARLRKLNPYMLSMHCVAHKLALASEAAASSVPYCKQHRSILKGIYNYFHTSPTHYSVLRDMMDLLNDPEVQIQQVHSVRWLTMHRAVEAIRKCYHSLLSTLSTLVVENDDIVAGGL